MKAKKRATSRRQTQLDRIERKLDELLKRQPVINITPRPGEWYVPYQINTTTPSPTEQPRYPTDPFGQPVPYAVSMGGCAMTAEASPRPWRVSESLSGTMSCILDANGEHIDSLVGYVSPLDYAWAKRRHRRAPVGKEAAR